MNILKFSKEYFWIVLIVFAGLALRLMFAADFSLSNDELSAINRLQFNNLSQVIEYGIKPDGHPAGVQILLYFFTIIFGNSPLAVRLPFILLSSLAPLFAYLFARKFSTEVASLTLASMIAFLPFPILYGILARPYGIGLTFSFLTALLWYKTLFEGSTKKINLNSIGFAVSLSLMAYFHYFAGLLSIVIVLTGFIFINRDNIVRYLISIALGAILFLPHLLITFEQMGHKGVGGWLDKPDSQWLWNHLYFLFDRSLLLIIAFFGLISLLIIEAKKLKINKPKLTIVMFLWVMIPFFAGYFYSIKVDSVLQNSVLIFSSFYLILAFLTFSELKFDLTGKILFLTFTAILIGNLLFFNPLKPNNHFADFESAAKDLTKWQNEHPRIVHFAQVNHPFYLTYYASDLQNLNKQTSIKSMEDIEAFTKTLNQVNAEYLSFANLKMEAPQLIHDILSSRFGEPIEVNKYGAMCETALYKCTNSFVLPKSLKNISTNEEFSFNIEKTKYNRSSDSMLLYSFFRIINAPEDGNIVLSIEDITGNTVHWESSPFRLFITNQQDSITNIRMKRRIKLPIAADKIKVYLWNPSKSLMQVERDTTDMIFF